MNAIELIKQILTKLTCLKENQIVIAQPGGDGYSHLYVIKDCVIIDIGELSYTTYICNFDKKKMHYELVQQFAYQASNYFKEPTKEKPVLIGNHELLEGVYKDIVKRFYST